MEIQQEDNGIKGRFFIEVDGALSAEMTYIWVANRIIIDHTEVYPALEGKGIGKQLVHRAVEMARNKGIKILPLCPFAKGIFDRVKEYQDVL
jgi:hypothetical protein